MPNLSSVRRRRDDDDAEVDAQSIGSFCRRNGISESFYFKLKAQGLGPREMRLGSRVLITREAAAAWRRQRERAAAEAAQKAEETAAVVISGDDR
jgi:hypothetical protein